MAATYEPIATTTLGSSASSYTFSSIPQTYTDLVLVLFGYGDGADGNSIVGRVGNGSLDTGANYSTTRMSGNNVTATTGRATNVDFMRFMNVSGQSTSSSFPTSLIINYMNYSNTNAKKTMINQVSQIGGSYPGTEVIINLWSNTAAINTIQIYPYSASFAAGTIITLYGIKAA